MLNRIKHFPFRHIHVVGLLFAACILSLLVQPFAPGTAVAAPSVITLPTLWEVGGLSAGNESAGQAARIATDSSGNVAVVSGPALGSYLAVTSYTADGAFRWQNMISPSTGVFLGDWVAAAPNGDFVAVGHNISGSSGNPIAISMVRYGSDGAFQWRVDIGGFFPSVGRLLLDSGGNAYLAFNTVGDGQDIRVHKYSPSGALLWSQFINTGFMSNNYATSLALSADQMEVVVTGDTVGGAEWITALYDTSTGNRKWLVVAPEGTAALDVVIDPQRVYVTGQGVTDPSTPALASHLTVIAYDRVTGAKLWRTDKNPIDGSHSIGLRMALSSDGSLVVTGQTSRGFLDWYTLSIETNGAVRWEAVRDGGLNTDEIPRGLLTLPDGTTVVTGPGGPNLPGGYIQGVTAGYSTDGTLLWEGFSRLATVWVTTLPDHVVCATGGYDALITCWLAPPTTPPTPTSTINPRVTPTPTATNTPGPGSSFLHVADIAMSIVPFSGNRNQGRAVVTIHDANNQPVSGATVNGAFTGDSNNSASGATNASGQITLTSSIVKNGSNWTFCVNTVTKSGLTYNPAANAETCDSTGADPTPSPTPTATPAHGGTMHIGDLDGSSAPGALNRWDATIVMTVHDNDDKPVSGVTVSGAWSAGASGSSSCITNASGQCSVSKPGTRNSVLSVTFTVTNANHSSLSYQSASNHDPDGDSNGTLIVVNQP